METWFIWDFDDTLWNPRETERNDVLEPYLAVLFEMLLRYSCQIVIVTGAEDDYVPHQIHEYAPSLEKYLSSMYICHIGTSLCDTEPHLRKTKALEILLKNFIDNPHIQIIGVGDDPWDRFAVQSVCDKYKLRWHFFKMALHPTVYAQRFELEFLLYVLPKFIQNTTDTPFDTGFC